MSAAKTTPPKQRGRPFAPGVSANPAGRPVGARNKSTMLAEKLLYDDAEAVVRAIIKAARGGDVAAGRAVLDRLLPAKRPGDRPISFSMPVISSAADAVNAMGRITDGVADGRLTPAEGESLARLIEVYRKVLETDQLERRVIELETRLAAVGPEHPPVDRGDALAIITAGLARIAERQAAALPAPS